MNAKKFYMIILSGGFDPIHKGHIRMFILSKFEWDGSGRVKFR